MRKQDRIANEKQRPPQEIERNKSEMNPTKREQLRGSESEPQRPPRKSGKLPLPD